MGFYRTTQNARVKYELIATALATAPEPPASP
jgi:hypothetical protein